MGFDLATSKAIRHAFDNAYTAQAIGRAQESAPASPRIVEFLPPAPNVSPDGYEAHCQALVQLIATADNPESIVVVAPGMRHGQDPDSGELHLLPARRAINTVFIRLDAQQIARPRIVRPRILQAPTLGGISASVAATASTTEQRWLSGPAVIDVIGPAHESLLRTIQYLRLHHFPRHLTPVGRSVDEAAWHRSGLQAADELLQPFRTGNELAGKSAELCNYADQLRPLEADVRQLDAHHQHLARHDAAADPRVAIISVATQHGARGRNESWARAATALNLGEQLMADGYRVIFHADAGRHPGEPYALGGLTARHIDRLLQERRPNGDFELRAGDSARSSEAEVMALAQLAAELQTTIGGTPRVLQVAPHSLTRKQDTAVMLPGSRILIEGVAARPDPKGRYLHCDTHSSPTAEAAFNVLLPLMNPDLALQQRQDRENGRNAPMSIHIPTVVRSATGH